MKDFKIILIVLFIISAVAFISLQSEKANADYTNVKVFTEIELDSTNNYFCTMAKERNASDFILVSNGCK